MIEYLQLLFVVDLCFSLLIGSIFPNEFISTDDLLELSLFIIVQAIESLFVVVVSGISGYLAFLLAGDKILFHLVTTFLVGSHIALYFSWSD